MRTGLRLVLASRRARTGNNGNDVERCHLKGKSGRYEGNGDFHAHSQDWLCHQRQRHKSKNNNGNGKRQGKSNGSRKGNCKMPR